MAHIEIGLTSKSSMSHVPLAVFGYALRHAEVLQPLQQLDLPIKAITHTASEKIMEALVLSWPVGARPPKWTCSCARIACWPERGAKTNLPNNPRWRIRWMP